MKEIRRSLIIYLIIFLILLGGGFLFLSQNQNKEAVNNTPGEG